jgi:hypothetical protein
MKSIDRHGDRSFWGILRGRVFHGSTKSTDPLLGILEVFGEPTEISPVGRDDKRSEDKFLEIPLRSKDEKATQDGKPQFRPNWMRSRRSNLSKR